LEQIEPSVVGFRAIPAALQAHFDLITFDQRGFGFSTGARCFPSTAAESKFLAALPPFPVGAGRTWPGNGPMPVRRAVRSDQR
jgi:pimeloyl-ACP methyl ester carboxylesterase